MKFRPSILLSSVFVMAACGSSGSGVPGTESQSPPAARALDVPGSWEHQSGDDDEKNDRCRAPDGLAALPGYSIEVWARGTSTIFNPDSIEWDGHDIWVGYQNMTTKDGSDGGAGFGTTSTVVEYDRRGQVERTFSVPGHCDGLRVDPTTHIVWASSNEDGNPDLTSIDPSTGTITHYTLDPTVHGGGYDDMAFQGGKFFIAASNPNLDPSGVNVFPALDLVTLNGTHAVVSAVLQGNATATDIATGSTVTLNEIDPDSITIDPSGDIVLDNQGGSELVFIQNAATPGQTVSRLSLPTQVDDTVWVTAKKGTLFVVDGKANAIYAVKTKFVVGDVFTETPDDSTIASMVGTLDVTTGKIFPQIIGFKKATGLLFVPDKK
jgi:hypothetical protein